MKKYSLLIIFTGLFTIPVFSQNSLQDKNWGIIFMDDFNSFNRGRWYKSHGRAHGKNKEEERQISDSANVYIDDGKLVIETKKLSCFVSCPYGNNCWYGGWHQYTSGAILSNRTYQYGYYEVYAKLPVSPGYWPAFWLWQQSPDSQTSNCWYNEIDIFETDGCESNFVTCNAPWSFECPPNNRDGIGVMNIPANNYDQIYHWYGIEWNRDRITWYVDRKSVRQTPNNMGDIGIQNPLQIILNVALQPDSGKCPMNNNTIFPNYMYVDQANGYRLNCESCTIVVNEISNFATFNYAVKKSITLSGNTSIPTNNNISLRATDFIELKAGFEAPLGVELYLDVNPCE